MINLHTYRSRLLVGKLLCSALVCMYGFVPYYLASMGVYTIPWAYDNLLFSSVFALIILFIPNYSSNLDLIKFEYSAWFACNKLKTITFFFIVCSISFHLWPWHEDRVSAGSSVSAVCRAIWVINTFCFVKESDVKKVIVMIMTAVLVFIDESRTYFIISFFVLAFSSRYVVSYFSVGMISLVVVAAVRVGENISGLELLTYGFIGEGYNGAKPVGQIFAISDIEIDSFSHLALTFLQPIYFPFEFIGNRLLGFNLPAQDTFFAEAVALHLGEKLSPMGGWYILADFVYYGYLGIPILFLYAIILWRFTSVLFDTRTFPYAPFIFFIAIKATPFVYVKFLYYIFFIAILLSALGLLKKGAMFSVRLY